MALTVNTNIVNDTNGYLLDAKNVKGGYIVVANTTERNGLPAATIVNGSLCYCTGDSKTYRYNGSTKAWVEESYDFLPLSGGTVDGEITATKFIGALQGNADTANFSKKINECQTNTINSTTNDTVANWGKQNTSIHFYGTSGLLNN
jgi:hypothetical protein